MFYDRFTSLCKQRGITPSRAAIEAGISKSLVTKWKSNKVQDPSAEVARKLSAYFGITVSELLGEETKKAAPLSGSGIDNRIVEVFSQLTAENQQRALDFLSGLLAAQAD